jgi:uncharacterized protein
MPSKKSGKYRKPAGRARSAPKNELYGPPPLVSFRWLLTAAATAVGIGAAGAYLVLCLIFYQNQAMLIFHPSRKITATPTSVKLAYQEIAFARNTHSQPQLTGWWIPAAKDLPHREGTILYLHGASGSLGDTVPQLEALHELGINVFAIDYRGCGKSAEFRPTEQTADQDTLAAWKYLTAERHLPAASLVVFGEGAGATFATQLAARRKVAGVVLAEMSPTAHEIFEKDARARLLPLFLLAKERMDPRPELKHLGTPKLFLDWPGKSGSSPSITRKDFGLAAPPKQIASLPSSTPETVANAVQPFLNQILPVAH